MKWEFDVIESLKKIEALQMKSSLSQIKNLVENLSSRLIQMEYKILGRENKVGVIEK
jgi:hypothetical protein